MSQSGAYTEVNLSGTSLGLCTILISLFYDLLNSLKTLSFQVTKLQADHVVLEGNSPHLHCDRYWTVTLLFKSQIIKTLFIF